MDIEFFALHTSNFISFVYIITMHHFVVSNTTHDTSQLT